jgi:hypothetical protein
MAAFLIQLALELLLGVGIGFAFLWLRGRRRKALAASRWQRWEAHCAAHMRETAGSTVITPPGPRTYTVADIDEEKT